MRSAIASSDRLVLAGLCTLVAAALPMSARPQSSRPASQTTGLLRRTLRVGGRDAAYTVFVPPGYDGKQDWPLIVFLHGRGECGTDGLAPTKVGLLPAVRADAAAWPFVVLLPQKPDRDSQWEEHDAMVMAMLAATRKELRIDDGRIYLTGLSQGGHGVWVLGARHKDVWAALAPVCGYGPATETMAADLKGLPIWAFHGEADPLVPVAQSRELVAAVQKAGGDARLTVYPGVTHNSWDKAYRDEKLGAWLLARARR